MAISSWVDASIAVDFASVSSAIVIELEVITRQKECVAGVVSDKNWLDKVTSIVVAMVTEVFVQTLIDELTFYQLTLHSNFTSSC